LAGTCFPGISHWYSATPRNTSKRICFFCFLILATASIFAHYLFLAFVFLFSIFIGFSLFFSVRFLKKFWQAYKKCELPFLWVFLLNNKWSRLLWGQYLWSQISYSWDMFNFAAVKIKRKCQLWLWCWSACTLLFFSNFLIRYQ
jgi:hypothetical protein